MFAKATNVGFAQQVVAILVASAVVLWSIGVYSTAQAANLTTISDTLSDSDVSVVSNHTIAFTVPAGSAGVLATETITVDFTDGPFTTAGILFSDVDFKINGADQVLAAAPSGATWGAVMSAGVLTLTSGTGAVAATDVIEIQVGTNATFGVAGANQITNPVAGSYELVLTAGAADTGRTRVAIIDNVLVTAAVTTSFIFQISGLPAATAVNGTSTTDLSTATTIPFGTLNAAEIKSIAQRLNVTTNAINGFVVTVESDGDLQSATGATIDNFDDGSDVAVPGTVWNAPSNSILDDKTWGHWGLTSNDSDLAVPFGANQFIAASTTPRQVFSHNGPSDGSTADKGQSDVLYQIEITPLQEAADDYNTTLTYIATPTF